MENNEEIKQLLYQLSTIVSKVSLDLEEYLEVIKESIKFNFKTDECYVLFQEKNPKFPEILDWIKTNKKTITSADIKNSWPFNFKKPHKNGSLIIFPLVDKDETLGIILVYWKENKPIKEYELEILKLISSQIISIYRISTLHEKVIKQRDQLKNLINELSFKLQTIEIQEKMWQTLFNTTDLGIILSDNKGKIINANPSIYKLIGVGKNKLEGLNICEARKFSKPFSSSPLCPPTDSMCPTMESIRKRKKIDYEELWLRRKNGESLWISVSAYPIFSKTSKLIMVIEIIRNIDKQKRLEKEKEDFITSVTHELRTPLTAVKGYLSMVLNNKDISFENRESYLEKSYEASEEMVNLVENMLEIIKMEDKYSLLNIKAVSCNKLIDDTIDSFEFKLKESQTRIEKNIKKESLMIFSDYNILNIIISNIIDNAIKYSKNGLIKISASSKGKIAEIKISDTGMGISKKNLKNVFNKFYRINDSTYYQISGSGLGLYITQKLVEKIGGKISIKSTEKVGTTFTINMPMASQLSLLNVKNKEEM